jgi:hypothetical protein
MKDIFEHIRSAVREHAGEGADALVARLYGAATKAELRPLLQQEVEHQVRMLRNLPAERSAGRQLMDLSDEVKAETRDFAARMSGDGYKHVRKLLRESFALGDGQRVAWGEATAEQHEQRIAFLAKQRDGLAATMERHRRALEIIRAAGASCLGEALQVSDEEVEAA